MKLAFRFFLIFISFTIAKSQNCHINNYNSENGQLPNSIKCLQFDGINNLWIGTNSGIYCYNGYKFYALSDNSIHPRIDLLLKDAENNLFIVDERHNLFKLKSGTLVPDKNFGIQKFEEWFLPKSDDYNKHLFYGLFNKLPFKNAISLSQDKSGYWSKLIPNQSSADSFFVVNNQLILFHSPNTIKSLNECGDIFTVEYKGEVDLIKDGLVFYGDQETFCLWKNTIYKFKINNEQLFTIPVLSSVNIDRAKHSLVSGQFNSVTGFYYFGSSKLGLFEVIPNQFTVIKNRSNTHIDSKYYGTEYYNQTEGSEGQLYVNN